MRQLSVRNAAFLIAILIAIGSMGICEEDPESILEETFKSVRLQLPKPDLSPVALIEDDLSPIYFNGGVLFGKLNYSLDESGATGTVILENYAVLALKKDHKGGVIQIHFSNNSFNNPVEASVRQFPFVMSPEKIELDGRPMEMEIAPGKTYVFIGLEQNIKISLSSIEFFEERTLSSPDEFKGIQISLMETSNTVMNYLR